MALPNPTAGAPEDMVKQVCQYVLWILYWGRFCQCFKTVYCLTILETLLSFSLPIVLSRLFSYKFAFGDI